MDLIVFLKGLAIGFAMAVPIGPVGIMCIRKSLAEGHARGMVAGLGAATADAIFSSIAAFGLTFVSDVIATDRFWLRLAGGVILLLLGIRTLRIRLKDPILPFRGKGFLVSYVSALMVALTNPVTIFAFIAVFAAFGLGHQLNIMSASLLVLGVLLGVCLWFLMLSYIATFFRKRLESGGLQWVNRISGLLIIVSGVAAFVSLM